MDGAKESEKKMRALRKRLLRLEREYTGPPPLIVLNPETGDLSEGEVEQLVKDAQARCGREVCVVRIVYEAVVPQESGRKL